MLTTDNVDKFIFDEGKMLFSYMQQDMGDIYEDRKENS